MSTEDHRSAASEDCCMSTVLYRNSSGKEVTHASYSSRQTFKKCPREFQLTRVMGWWGRDANAAMWFGRCIESGFQAYEESQRSKGEGIKAFTRLWHDVKLLPEFEKLKYTACEGSWEQLLKSGREMMRLFEIKAPSLPLEGALFQQKLRKTIFPGTNLAALENVAVLDILSFPRWDHPMLPKIEKPDTENEPRSLIIDCKTSGKEFPVDLVALDPQLSEYAWQTRISDVAFLWFVKKGHGQEKGSKITLLEDAGAFWSGWEGVVVDVGDADSDGRHWTHIGTWDTLQRYEEALKGLRGKIRETTKQNFIDTARADGSITSVSDESVTKQRLQFAAARLTEQDMDEVGRSVAQTTVEMVRAHEADFYEKQPGVRFPNEKCNFCSMRWICLNRPDERDKNLTRKGEEWLDGIQDEGAE